MQPELPQWPRTRLNGSALVDLLGQLALVDPPRTATPFVEGLGHWLGWRESIPLAAVLQGDAQPVTRAGAATPTGAGPSGAEPAFNRVRQALSRAIADETSTAREDGASFVPFRRRYFGLQQAMQSAIGPLRAQLRAALAQQPAAPMRRLAALDAALANALATREQQLLALMPVLLEKHFSKLRQAAPPAQAALWLPTFRNDMRRLLTAELDLRLQPAQGLLETLLAPPAPPQLS